MGAQEVTCLYSSDSNSSGMPLRPRRSRNGLKKEKVRAVQQVKNPHIKKQKTLKELEDELRRLERVKADMKETKLRKRRQPAKRSERRAIDDQPLDAGARVDRKKRQERRLASKARRKAAKERKEARAARKKSCRQQGRIAD